ncbi:MAG: VTT domain-containing protein [Flavobacteriales bacterium]
MIELLQHLFALDIKWFVQEFGTAVYIVLFLVIFIETGLVAFPFLPGDSLLFTAGLFCKSGQLDLIFLLPLLFIAAILGDNINYWVGRKIGFNVFSLSFRGRPIVKKEYLDKTTVFFEKHGTKAIIMARFVPFVRTFAPFAAGVASMKYRTFVVYDILGGALWVGSMLIAGYLLGEITWIREHVDLMAIAIVLLSVSPVVLSYLKNRSSRG